jgi:diphthamide synthase subunit DPH2
MKDVIKSVLRIIGYVFMCLTIFAITMEMASGHETPPMFKHKHEPMVVYKDTNKKCIVIAKHIEKTTTYSRLRLLRATKTTDVGVFCILAGFKSMQNYVAPVQITVQYNWVKGTYVVSNDGL